LSDDLEETGMLASSAVYPIVLAWLDSLGGLTHRAARQSVAHLLTAALVAQSLRATALMRALASAPTVPARQRYKRVARVLRRAWLSPAQLTPVLVRAALVLADAAAPTLAIDGVHCGGWEIVVIGLVWHGRVLPLGWLVVGPQRKPGQYAHSVRRLLGQVDAAWPAAQPRPHLVADRGFTGVKLVGWLQQHGWGFTLRLRARQAVTRAGTVVVLRTLLDDARAGSYRQETVCLGTGGATQPATLVLGSGLSVLRRHQRDDGSARARARQQHRRQEELGRTAHNGPHAAQTASWLLLLTTEPSVLRAVRRYRQRWAIEGSFRDAQSGWDGRAGWDLERAVARLGDAAAVDGLVGLWALGTLVQSWLGAACCGEAAPALLVQAAGGWTTTGRLSVWARGKLLLTSSNPALQSWLRTRVAEGADRLRPTAAPSLPAAA
jgi:Transposase DDE domain